MGNSVQLLNAEAPTAEGATNGNPLEAVSGGPPLKLSFSASSSPLVRDDDASGSCGKVPCDARPRVASGSKISFNRFKGVNVLILSGLLLLLHIEINQHPLVAALQSAYDGVPPHDSSLSTAAHVLDQRRGFSALLLLAALPLWKGLALSGLLRLLLSILRVPQAPDTGVYPGVSGLPETVAALALLLLQEIEEDTLLQLVRSEPSKAIIPGLLFVGLILIISSAYRIVQWKWQWRKQKLSQKPAMQLGKPYVYRGPGRS
ncbi:hypothetical protein ACSSS7_002405 [Eimeria intestinalis]